MPKLMTPHQITRTLRQITGRQQRRQPNHITIVALSAMTGLSRETIHQARDGNGLTPRVITLLSSALSGQGICQNARCSSSAVAR
jgi:hypothetical protein